MTCSDKRSPMKVNFSNCGKKHWFRVKGKFLDLKNKSNQHFKYEKTKNFITKPSKNKSFLTKNVPTIHINQRFWISSPWHIEEFCRDTGPGRTKTHHLSWFKRQLTGLKFPFFPQRNTEIPINILTWWMLRCYIRCWIIAWKKRMVAVGLLCTFQTKWQYNKLLANM